NRDGGYLEGRYFSAGPSQPFSEVKVKLYPIPFSAAKGVPTWKGQSFSTNIGSDEDLIGMLENLAAGLEDSPVGRWSYSTDTLPGRWNGDDFYSPATVHKQYFGLVREPQGA